MFMGYRHYFYMVEKDKLRTLHALNNIDAINQWIRENKASDRPSFEGVDEPLYDIGSTFFELGKYYEHEKRIHQTGVPLFKNKNIQESYEEYEPYWVGPEAILAVIQEQQKAIVKSYQDALNPNLSDFRWVQYGYTTKEEVYAHMLKQNLNVWERGVAIDTDINDPVITHAWLYECNIYELVRLYKSTDWNTYGLIFLGW